MRSWATSGSLWEVVARDTFFDALTDPSRWRDTVVNNRKRWIRFTSSTRGQGASSRQSMRGEVGGWCFRPPIAARSRKRLLKLYSILIFSIFTALHVMQTRYSEENSVCLFVRLSVRLSVTRVIPDKTEERSVQICIRGVRVYPYPRVYRYPTRNRGYGSGTGVLRVGSGTGTKSTGRVYPFLPAKNAIFHDVRAISNVSFLPF